MPTEAYRASPGIDTGTGPGECDQLDRPPIAVVAVPPAAARHPIPQIPSAFEEDSGPGPEEEADPGPLAPDRRRRGVTAAFRLAGTHRPPPPNTRVLAMYAWATGLGIAALAVALRGLAAILAGTGPGWYEPALATVGLGGVGLTVAAFMSTQRARLPWIMLALTTATVAANVGLTIVAL